MQRAPFRQALLVVGIDDEALGERDVPFLSAEPALGVVEQPLELVMLARDAGHGDPSALPDVVVVDLGDGRADAVLELRLRRAEVVALLLQRMRVRKVQLTGEDADESARHTLIQAESAHSDGARALRSLIIVTAVPTLFELIDAGDAEGVRKLLEVDAGAAATRDEHGLSAFMCAAYAGVEVFHAVRAADPPLDPFDRIVAGESRDLPAPDAWTPDGFTGLHLAAFARNAPAARLLLEAGADPNVLATASFAQVTPLGTCAFAGANEVARLLLAHAADTELTSDRGGTPLHSAAQNGNRELAELLLAHGADRDARTETGQTPADLAADDELRDLLT